jgi:RNA polymerase sigma factor (sigma-70 family)
VAALWCKPIKVIATGRKPEEIKDLSATHGDSIRAVKLNATSPADVEKAVATAVSSEGSRHERARDAQTVVQEAYIQALNEFVEFRGTDARAWLLAIVRNAAYTWIQKRGNNSSMIPFEEAIHVAPTDQPLSESSDEAQKRRLNEALTRLPVELREILVLREIEGWSYKQLASALNVSAATVVSRLIQARRRLRQEVAGIET